MSVGPKNLVAPAHFISSPRPTSRRKKCLRMNKESPSCQETSPRTILSSATQGHGRRKGHALKDSLPGRPQQKGLTQWPVIGAWWRSNSRRGCHLRIKYPQLTSWPHLCWHDPWIMLSRSPQLTKRQKEWLIGCALKYRHGWLTSVGP